MKGRSKVAVALVGACLTLAFSAGPASGQILTPDWAAPLSERDIPPGERARDSMNRYAQCIVRTRLRAVKDALVKAADAEIEASLAGLATYKCLEGGELRMSRELFRGALYRALFIREYSDAREMPPLPPSEDGAVAPSGGALPDNPLRFFGDCVVQLAAGDAQKFVMASVATPEEKAAIDRLMPALAGCVRPGDQISFSPGVLQGAVAEALYRRATTAARLTEATEH